MCDSALLLSESLGFSYSNTTDDDHKSKYGQFFTPKEVAMFMASFAGKTLCSKEHIHILDPGAGTGILTVSLCHYLVQQAPPTTLKKITCTLYE
jgi:adenine-specific DNA-methyltransferase